MGHRVRGRHRLLAEPDAAEAQHAADARGFVSTGRRLTGAAVRGWRFGTRGHAALRASGGRRFACPDRRAGVRRRR